MDNEQSVDPRILILEAEATPIFRHQSQPVLDFLSVATQLDPEELEDSWVVRLALRMSDVLLMQGELERAAIWTGVAKEKSQYLGDFVLSQRATIQAARLDIAHQRYKEAEIALRKLRGDWARHPDPIPPGLQSKLDLTAAELHFAIGDYTPIGVLLEPRLAQPEAFSSLDDLWRALNLCARSHQMFLEFEAAEIHFARMVDMAKIHDATQEEADARLGLGQSLLGQTKFQEGLAQIKQAASQAKGALWQTSMNLLVSATLTTDNIDGALKVAKQAAVQAAHDDDYKTYINIVGVVTGLYRLEKRHKDAYRDLVGIYGLLKAKFGDDATKPVREQIALLREDLGEEAFERLSAELLAERKQQPS